MKKMIFLTIIMVLVITPVIAVSDLIWENDFAPAEVVDVDTNEDGSIVFVALSNGTVASYNAEGVLQWETAINGTLKKIKTISTGNKLVTFNNLNQSYLINGVNGVVSCHIFGTDYYNVSDVGISRNGSYFVVSGNSSTVIYDSSCNVFASNMTFYNKKRFLTGFDPDVGWVINALHPNQTIKWNVTPYSGWSEMNPMRDSRNDSQVRFDGFQARRYFTNGINTSSYIISFKNDTTLTTSVAQFSFIDNSTIGWYKPVSRNFSIVDSDTLEDLIIATNGNYSCEEGQYFNVSIQGGHPNFSIFSQNVTYKPSGYGVITP